MSKTLIVGISGKMRHGKDTIGDYIINRYRFKRASFAEKVKDICINYRNDTAVLRGHWNQKVAREIFPNQDETSAEPWIANAPQAFDDLVQSIHPGEWPRLSYEECYHTKPPHVRKTMQLLAEGARGIWKDCWVSYLLNRCYKEGGKFVITDLRYQNEAFAIEAHASGGLGYAQLWRVWRNLPEQPGSDHISETDLDDYPFEVFVENNGTIDELHREVDKIIRPILRGDRAFARGGDVY